MQNKDLDLQGPTLADLYSQNSRVIRRPWNSIKFNTTNQSQNSSLVKMMIPNSYLPKQFQSRNIGVNTNHQTKL